MTNKLNKLEKKQS